MTIGFILPCMRAESALQVLDCFEKQTLKPDYFRIVDNKGDFTFNPSNYSFEIELIKPESNVGTNAVWNMVYQMDHDYIGVVGDDYIIPSYAVEILVTALNRRFDVVPTGITSAKIVDGSHHPNPLNRNDIIEGRRIQKAKGHFGLFIGRKEFWGILPPIPSEFKIFFGDNWWGHWINALGYAFIMVISITIVHYHKTDLAVLLNYKEIIKQERFYWNEWNRGNIKLG